MVELAGGSAIIHGRRVVRVRGDARVATALLLLKEGTTTERLREAVGSRVDGLVAEFRRLGLITSDPPPTAISTMSRQYGYLSLFTPFAASAQDALRASHVAVVGAGGVGSVVLQQLMLAGIGRFTLIDPDVVGQDNLNRQVFFAMADVGMPKVEVLGREMTRLRPGLSIRAVEARIEESKDLDLCFAEAEMRPDAVVSAADEPTSVATVITDWCSDRDLTVIEAAAGLGAGYAGPLYTNTGRCCPICFRSALRDSLEEQARELQDLAEGRRTAWSFGPANTIVSSIAAHDLAVHLAGGKPGALDTRVSVDFSDWSITTFRGSACPHRGLR